MRILFSVVGLCGAILAQTITTNTGTIQELTGMNVTSGKLIFPLKPSRDPTISGVARFASGVPVQCSIGLSSPRSITAYRNSANHCVVKNNTSLTPSGTYYQGDVCPLNACSSRINFFALGGSLKFPAIAPTPATVPVQSSVDLLSTQTTNGNKTFSGTTTFSGPLTTSGSVAFATLTGPTAFNGTFTLSGAATLSAPTNIAGAAELTGTVNVRQVESTAFVDASNSQGWSGSDIGGWINSAYAALPSSGGDVYLAATNGCASFATPIVFGVNSKVVRVRGAGPEATCLQYTATSGVAMTLDTGIVTDKSTSTLNDFRLTTNVSAAQTKGLIVGVTNGCKKCITQRVTIDGFIVQATSQSLFAEWRDVTLGPCSTYAGAVGYRLIAPGDDDHWYDGTIHQCQTDVDLTSNANGPLVMFGTTLFGPATGGNYTAHVNMAGANNVMWCYGCHFVMPNTGSGPPTAVYWNLANVAALYLLGGTIENDASSGSDTSWAAAAGHAVLHMDNLFITSAGRTATELTAFSGNAGATMFGNNISAGSAGALWNNSYTGAAVMELGTTSTSAQTNVIPGFVKFTSGGSLQLLDQGHCTMASGTCSAQSLAHTYSTAPQCFANWTGTGALTGLIKVPSTTTTVTPASSVSTDTAMVNWACFGT